MSLSGSYDRVEADSIMINDIVQTVKENWDDPEAWNDKITDTEVLVFDHNDQRIAATDDKTFENIYSPMDAVREEMIAIAVKDGDHYIGTVVIPDPAAKDYEDLVHRLIVITAAVSAVLLISYASFLYYVNRNIIKPFERMKNFAGLIAEGKLDEPLLMEKDNIFGIFTESFDVMREELKASRQREIDLKMKEKELVASLSHDLKTPVTGIRVICELLAVKVQDGYVKGKIENIEQKTEEINILLSDLLSSALDDMGEMNVNICEVTSDVLPAIVEEHDIHKKVSSEKVPDCILKTDRNRMSQVIGNIISNSYKYAGTNIDISYKFSEKYLEMIIRDYGEGVNEDEIDLLTSKFYRGKKNAAGKEGSGLGLYISSELMKKMNGQLICLSDREGFEVTLVIPLA
jgi:signal transduction histidine kinase